MIATKVIKALVHFSTLRLMPQKSSHKMKIKNFS